MSVKTFSHAVREALTEEMRRDNEVYLMGLDIKYDVWGITGGLQKEFGEDRVLHTPISENGFVGVGLGSSIVGMRPVVSLLFCDFLAAAADSIVNQAAKFHYFNGGGLKVPLTIRVQGVGGGKGAGCHHAQSLEPLFAHFPGLKLAVPSTPYEAKGLLKAAIRDDNPVLFFESKMLYPTEGQVPDDEDLVLPFGKAEVVREGSDITVVSYSLGVKKTLEAAEILSREGIEAEVISLRTLKPLDKDTILNSLAKTNRFAVVEEAHKFLGMGAELTALVAEYGLEYLAAPVKRVGAYDVPIPGSKRGEQVIYPSVQRIADTIKEVVNY